MVKVVSKFEFQLDKELERKLERADVAFCLNIARLEMERQKIGKECKRYGRNSRDCRYSRHDRDTSLRDGRYCGFARDNRS